MPTLTPSSLTPAPAPPVTHFETFVRSLFNPSVGVAPIMHPDDEADFLDLLVAHGIAPIVLQKIQSEGRPVSESFKTRIIRIARDEMVFHEETNRQILPVLTALGSAGIRSLLLKGGALATHLYPEPGTRPRADTDIFVDSADLPQAAELLIEHKFRPTPEAGVEKTQACEYRKSGRFGISHIIDLHESISNSRHQWTRTMTFTTLWQDSLSIKTLPESTRVPSCSHALLHACFHRGQHYSHLGDRLIWLHDISLLVESLDRELLNQSLQLAKNLNIGAIVANSILVARHWFNTDLHEETLKELRSTEFDESLTLLERDLDLGIANRAMLNLRHIPGFTDKVRYVLRRLFPQPDYMLMIYASSNRFMLPLFYIRRIITAARIGLIKFQDDRSESS